MVPFSSRFVLDRFHAWLIQWKILEGKVTTLIVLSYSTQEKIMKLYVIGLISCACLKRQSTYVPMLFLAKSFLAFLKVHVIKRKLFLTSFIGETFLDNNNTTTTVVLRSFNNDSVKVLIFCPVMSSQLCFFFNKQIECKLLGKTEIRKTGPQSIRIYRYANLTPSQSNCCKNGILQKQLWLLLKKHKYRSDASLDG